MAMHFDAEQTEAINTKDTSILVSASAGAGKTGVLVARLMKRCVADRIPIQSILAVTFTDAAAGEMKKRLAKQLHAEYFLDKRRAQRLSRSRCIVCLQSVSTLSKMPQG